MNEESSYQNSKCPGCGEALPAHAPLGLCPRCLMQGSQLSGDDETDPLPTGQSGQLGRAMRALEGPGAVIGRYKLLQRIGEGGFGMVHMAEQQEPVVRKVALKIIKLGMDTRNVIARFEAERQALALMDHPHIASVLDAGATEAGRPYFVMELVNGIPITQFCEENNLTTEARLELFRSVCLAIQHAHQKGIIHRDLKPTNVLVTMNGDQALPKVIDFGIAKATQTRLTEKTLFTQFQQFIGTPAYMSPEQARISAVDVDTRSDIYSLGVLLYELLTGSTPFDTAELMKSGLDEMRRIIREREPLRPSTRLTRLRTHGKSKIQHPRSKIDKDLDSIVMKAIEKDRTRRYETANALAADIKRFLNREPVLAVAPSVLYQFRKLANRNRLVFATSLVVLLALILGLGVAVIALVGERAAQAEAAKLQYASDMKLALVAVQGADVESAFVLLDQHRPAPGDLDLRGWEWRYLDQFRNLEVATLHHSGSISEVDVLPDGSAIVVGHRTGAGSASIRFIKSASLEEIDSVALPESPWVGGFTFLSAEHSLVLEDNSGKGLRRVSLDAMSLQPFPSGELLKGSWPPRVSPDGKWFVGSFEGKADSQESHNGREKPLGRGLPQPLHIRCIEVESQREMARTDFTAPDQRMLDHELRISPDSKRVAVACADATVRLYSVPELRLLHTFHTAGSPTCLQWSRDAGFLTAVSELPNVAQVWDVGTMSLKHELVGVQKSPSYDVCLSSDGSLLASATYDKLIILWDLLKQPPVERAVFRGHRALPTSVTFSPDGARLFSADQAGDLKIWDTSPQDVSPLRALAGEQIGRLTYTQDGTLLAVSSREGVVRLFESESERLIAILKPGVRSKQRGREFGKDSYPPLAFSADGRYLIAGNGDNTATLYDVLSRTPIRQIQGHEEVIHACSFSPDTKTIYTVSEDATLKSWDRLSGKLLKSTPNPLAEEALYAVDCAPNGSLLAVAGKHMGLTLRDTETHAIVATLPDQEQQSYRPPSINSVRFSPDGKLLVCGLQNEMMLFAVPALNRVATFTGLSGPVSSVDFTSDGETLIGVSERGMSQMVNLKVMRAVGDLARSQGRLISARFSPDGQTLAVSGLGAGIRMFHAPLTEGSSRPHAYASDKSQGQ